MTNLMGEWLARDLFDELPEGVPALDKEDDDEEVEPTPTEEDEAALLASGPDSIDTDTSVCIVALPTEGQNLPGPESDHVTLLYLGHFGEDGDGAPSLGEYGNLLANVTNIAAKAYAPFTASVESVGPLGDEGAVVAFLSPDSSLPNVRDDLLEIDSEVASLLADGTFTKYDEFKPHLTLGYRSPKPDPDKSITAAGGWCAPSDTVYEMSGEPTDADIEAAEALTSIEFDRLALWFGDEHIEFPLIGTEPDAYSKEPARGDKGTERGGQFIRPDMDNQKSDDEDGDGFESKLERERNMVKAILEALESVMGDLTSEQARALMKRVKANAKAFLDATEKDDGPGSQPKGGGGKGSDKGGSGSKDGPDKKGGGDKDSSGGSGGSGGGGPSGTVEAILKSLVPLLKGFGKNMDPKDKQALDRAVKELEK